MYCFSTWHTAVRNSIRYIVSNHKAIHLHILYELPGDTAFLHTTVTIEELVKAVKDDVHFADMWNIVGRVVEFFDGRREEPLDLGDAVTMLLQRVAHTDTLAEFGDKVGDSASWFIAYD